MEPGKIAAMKESCESDCKLDFELRLGVSTTNTGV